LNKLQIPISPSGIVAEPRFRPQVSVESRRQSLRTLLSTKGCLRVIEAHSPLSAIVAETAAYDARSEIIRFDALWSSSLTDSAVRGTPDNEALDIHRRLENIGEVSDVTSLPLIMDVDTGGQPEHFIRNLRSIERSGVSAIIVEDKKGLKRNSLFGTDVPQEQDDIRSFSHKLALGKMAQSTADFMIIARIESLILDAGMADALARAASYIDAGADGIMIHSRRKSSDEIAEFTRIFRKDCPNVPLVCVPTSFNSVTFGELKNLGFNIVIYANHLLRAAFPAMKEVAAAILKNGRTLEIEDNCLPISEMISLIP
jgi:phosphoenolpyruvate phosphomutase